MGSTSVLIVEESFEGREESQKAKSRAFGSVALMNDVDEICINQKVVYGL